MSCVDLTLLSLVEVQLFGATCCLNCRGIPSFNLKMEARYSSKISVSYYHISWCYISEDSNLPKCLFNIVL
jgi:hypothetical protein